MMTSAEDAGRNHAEDNEQMDNDNQQGRRTPPVAGQRDGPWCDLLFTATAVERCQPSKTNTGTESARRQRRQSADQRNAARPATQQINMNQNTMPGHGRLLCFRFLVGHERRAPAEPPQRYEVGRTGVAQCLDRRRRGPCVPVRPKSDHRLGGGFHVSARPVCPGSAIYAAAVASERRNGGKRHGKPL